MSAHASYFIGLDLGQSQDFTALAVVERTHFAADWDPVLFAPGSTSLVLRFLQRVELGTPYPDVVARVRTVTHSPRLAGNCTLVVDATGVGRPVVDLLRRADLGCSILPAVITAGEAESSANGYHRVPKRDFIIGLQVLLQRKRLQIADNLQFGAALAQEMAEMRVKVTGSGHEQYGSWRQGTHDDLVFAVALACWQAQRFANTQSIYQSRPLL